MRYLVILFLFFTLKVGYSQVFDPKDSLIRQIQIMSMENPQESRRLVNELERIASESSNNELKIKVHIAQSDFYITNNLWSQARLHIDKALSLVNSRKDKSTLIDIHLQYSKLFFKSGDKAASAKAISDANKLAESSNNTDQLIKIKLIQADYLKQDGAHIESVKIKKQALNLSQNIQNKNLRADCFQSIGSSYWQTGHYNEALENYYKSLLIREKNADTLGIIQSLKNIGLSYRELGQYEKGISNLEKSLKLSQSLKDVYETSEILNIIGSLHFRFNRFDEAIKFYTQSLDIRIKLGLIRSQIISYENIARALSQKNAYEEALKHLGTALTLQEQIVDPIAESSTLTEMGNLNLQKGNVAEALRRYLMALKLRQQFGRDEEIAKSLTNIGLAYRRLGMYKSALKYFEQAQEIINSKEISNNDAAYILQNLGHIYLDQKEYTKALTTYKSALTLKERGGDETGTAKILKNIAQTQLQMLQESKARTSLSQALKITIRNKDIKEQADILNEMGNVERKAKNLELAINYFGKAAELYQQSNNFDGKALCTRKIGEIQILKKQYAEAEKNIDLSIKTGFQTGNAYLRSYGYLAKHDLFRAKGNYKLALSFYIQHTAIKDSLENIKRNETNLEAQLDLELDQKKTEIKVMEAEVDALRQKAELDNAIIEKQKTFRNLLIAIALLFITVAGATTLSFIQKRTYAKALEEKIDEIKQINDKLIQSEKDLKQTVQTKDKLFSIIAHDLRSPFTALVGLSEVLWSKSKNLSTDEISELSKHIYDSANGVLSLTDNLLNWSRSQTGKLTLNPDIHALTEIISRIIEVASIPAKEKGVEIEHKTEPNLKIFADYDTISTAIRNLISNAIKFTPQGGIITITATQNGGNAEIKIRDTGVGIEPENLSKLFKVDGLTTKGTNQESGTGLGLILCKEFVEKNNGKISVESHPGVGTTFRIALPINTINNDQETV